MALQARVLYDFEGDVENGELTIAEGETITVINQDIGDGWWEGELNNGQRGLFPEAYVEVLSGDGIQAVASGGYNGDQQGGYTNEYGGEWEDQHTSYYQQDADQSPPSYNRGDSFQSERTNSVSGDQLSRHATVKKNINRFSPFVKVGAESYVLGHAIKKAPRIADAEKIRIIASPSDSEPMWEPPAKPYSIQVKDPEKKSKFKGIKTFTAYSVIPEDTGLPVSRRYKQYDWLHDRLTEKFTSIAIPPLPDKQYYGRYGEEFVTKRKDKLEAWSNRVARHPVLSQSFVFRHFLTCAEESEWKAGKRRAEKDEFCGAQLLLTIEHPDVRTELNKATEKVEHFGKFIAVMDDTCNKMFQKFDDHCNKMSGPIMREWHRMSAVITGLAQCFHMEDAPYARGLTAAIHNTGSVYEEIGNLHGGQPKFDMIPIMDGIKEYLGMMHELPDFVQINRGSQNKVKDSERLKDDGRLDMVEASEIQSRTETVATTLLAEIHHFQHERVTDFRKMFQDMLNTQISFYSNIVSKLQDTLDKFDVGQDYSGGGAVSNHEYSPNHDIPGYPGTDL